MNIQMIVSGVGGQGVQGQPLVAMLEELDEGVPEVVLHAGHP